MAVSQYYLLNQYGIYASADRVWWLHEVLLQHLVMLDDWGGLRRASDGHTQMTSLSLSTRSRVICARPIVAVEYGLSYCDGRRLKRSGGWLQSRALCCRLLCSSSLEVGIEYCLSPGSLLLRSFSFEDLVWLSIIRLSERLYRWLSWQLIVSILAGGRYQSLLPRIRQMMALLQQLYGIRNLAAI